MLSNMTSMEDIVSLCKRRGFIFQGSEIYGGLANSWDYGPLGTELKNNIKQLWWDRFVRQRDDMVGIDAAIIMNPKVWIASGHVATFADPLVEDTVTHQRHRAEPGGARPRPGFDPPAGLHACRYPADRDGHRARRSHRAARGRALHRPAGKARRALGHAGAVRRCCSPGRRDARGAGSPEGRSGARRGRTTPGSRS